MPCALAGRLGSMFFGSEVFGGEVRCIMWSTPPLPYLTASRPDREEDSASREEGQIRRTQSTVGLCGSRGRGKLRGSLKKAHNVSTELGVTENEPLCVCYWPRAFKGVREDVQDLAKDGTFLRPHTTLRP